MILDNENQNLKVHEWIKQYTEECSIDIVTGYFTVGALAYLSQQVKSKNYHVSASTGRYRGLSSKVCKV
ncbi:MAG: hypothetical protein IM531_11340 [Pseudanabaena sp. M090S1SP1A06QC]|jgi:hypothetical protein|nr:hypothetical protein [Pseudanabaena sp. M090S1SP1A06QC]